MVIFHFLQATQSNFLLETDLHVGVLSVQPILIALYNLFSCVFEWLFPIQIRRERGCLGFHNQGIFWHILMILTGQKIS